MPKTNCGKEKTAKKELRGLTIILKCGLSVKKNMHKLKFRQRLHLVLVSLRTVCFQRKDISKSMVQ